MDETIGVIADSTADLPSGLAKKKNIHLIPIHILVNNQDHLHGVNIVNQEVVEHLKQKHDVSTSPPFPGEYTENYQKMMRRYDRVYSFHVSKELSNCYSSANNSLELLGEQVSSAIHIIDTRTVSIAQGQIVNRIAGIARNNPDIQRLNQYINWLVKHSMLFFVVDNLFWLKRAGKLNMLSSIFGKMLDIKPVIGMDNGVLTPIEKCRGKESAVEGLIRGVQKGAATLLNQRKDVEIWVGHSDTLLGATQIQEQLCGIFKKEKSAVPIVEMGPTMTAHTGPGCLCVSLLPR